MNIEIILGIVAIAIALLEWQIMKLHEKMEKEKFRVEQ